MPPGEWALRHFPVSVTIVTLTIRVRGRRTRLKGLKTGGEVRMPKKILVADDDKAMLGLYDRIFSDTDYSVSKAASFSEASKLLAEKTFDLLITDFMFPDGLGTELAAIFRQKRRGAKCLLVTGSPSATPDLRSGFAGRCLEKPFKVEDLLEAVGQAFS